MTNFLSQDAMAIFLGENVAATTADLNETITTFAPTLMPLEEPTMQPPYPPTRSPMKHPTLSPTNQSSEDVATNGARWSVPSSKILPDALRMALSLLLFHVFPEH